MTEALPVLFRKDRGKNPEVTAVFPTEPASHKYGEMTCYTHVGQHGGCSRMWYNTTRAAVPGEYAALLTELRQIYEEDEDEPVKLVVYKRITTKHRDEYRRNYNKMMKPEG